MSTQGRPEGSKKLSKYMKEKGYEKLAEETPDSLVLIPEEYSDRRHIELQENGDTVEEYENWREVERDLEDFEILLEDFEPGRYRSTRQEEGLLIQDDYNDEAWVQSDNPIDLENI